jgi:hypothetical protein
MFISENFSDRGDFSEPNNIVIGFRHDPAPYVLCMGQAVSRAFDKGEWNGVWHCKIRKAPAVLQMLKQFCVVALEKSSLSLMKGL